jgi:hypothetical protein
MKVAFFSLWIVLVAIGIAQSETSEVSLENAPKQELIESSSPKQDPALRANF